MSDVLALTVPALLAGVGLYGALTGTDVFSALTAGALDGLRTVVRIFPALVALLAAVSMLRASGALDALTRLCAPVLAWLGIPPETAILMVVRPVSGSGALAAASDIIGAYGPDSRIPLQIKKTSNPLRLLVFLCLSMLRGAFGNLCGAKNVADLRLFFA